jgi:very-short-patch-repair endonuclease
MPERHITNIRSKVKPWKKKVAAKMSRNKTWPEKILWKRLKDKQLGVNIYAQKIMYGYIVDFWCPLAAVVVEIDGKTHLAAKQKIWDARRDAVMRSKGISVMRFTNQEVTNSTVAVVALIKDRILKRLA